jgi:hypothetical protein
MRLFTSYALDLLRHAFGNFVVAVAIFGFALGLTYLEDLLKVWQRPEWLQDGVHVLSQMLFIIDGIAICGTSVILVFRMMRNALSPADQSQGTPPNEEAKAKAPGEKLTNQP